MEPPSKKPRLSHSLDQDGDELDLSIEDLALDRQFQRSTYRSAFSFKSTLENIFEKYGRDFGDEGDEIDLNTGEITVDRGHFRGIFGANLPVATGDDGADAADQEDEEGDEDGDDEDGIDLNQLYSEDEEEDDEEEGSIDLEADGDGEEESRHLFPLDAMPDPSDVPEPPQLPPSFSALESSVNGGQSTSGTLLGTLNRLLSMAAASRGTSDPSFDPLSVTNELVEPAWRVPALPPALLQKKPAVPVNTKSSAALKSIVRKPRPRLTHDTESEDEITTRESHIGPEWTSSNQQIPSPNGSITRSAASPENSGCTQVAPNQESHTKSTSRAGKSKHHKPHSDVTARKSPPPTEDERDVVESRCMELDGLQRQLKRKHETIVIHIIDERLQKLEQDRLLLNAPVGTPQPVRQGLSVRGDSVVEFGSEVLVNPESSSRPREFTDEGLLETSTESAKQIPGAVSSIEETTKLSPRLPSEAKTGPTNQSEAPAETFTKNYVDPSYGFSDEENGGWVPAPKAAGRGRRRGPLILRPRSVSPELGSPPRPARSPPTMPEPVTVATDITLSKPPSSTGPDAEAEPQSEQPLVDDAEHQNTPPAASEDYESSMLVGYQPPEAAAAQDPTVISVGVEEGEASQSSESSGLGQPVDESVLEENLVSANEQHVEQASELDGEVKPQTSVDSSLSQPEISLRRRAVPQDQTSLQSSPQSFSTQLGNKRSSGKQGSAYLPRRTRRQWLPKGNVPHEALSMQDTQPATPSPPAAQTSRRRSVRSVASLLSFVNGGSDEDELSTYFTPRTRSVASGGGYAGPARLYRETLSSPIKKKTPRSLSRRLFMTKASSSAQAKPKLSSFSLLSGAQFHTTPLSHRERTPGSGSGSVRSRLNSSPVRSVIQTPGGSKRRCGEEGFRCDRDWCFFCIGDQQ